MKIKKIEEAMGAGDDVSKAAMKEMQGLVDSLTSDLEKKKLLVEDISE